jgi:hypothetical protein
VAEQSLPVVAEAGRQRGPDVGAERRQRDGVEDAIEDGVHQLVLAPDVRVQRRRLDVERGGQPAHRERVAPIPVEDAEGLVDDGGAGHPAMPASLGPVPRPCHRPAHRPS